VNGCFSSSHPSRSFVPSGTTTCSGPCPGCRSGLTKRLKELEAAGFIVRAETRRGYVRWELTEKGADVVPILLTMVQFGSKWYADEVYSDKTARPLNEIFDEAYVRKELGLTPAGSRRVALS